MKYLCIHCLVCDMLSADAHQKLFAVQVFVGTQMLVDLAQGEETALIVLMVSRS